MSLRPPFRAHGRDAGSDERRSLVDRAGARGIRRRVLRAFMAGMFLIGVAGTALVTVTSSPAAAAPPAPTWAEGQYFAAIQNVPFCDDVSVTNSAALPLTSITAGTAPSGFNNYSIQDVNLNAGTAQVCGPTPMPR